jgi:hypothetical protein
MMMMMMTVVMIVRASLSAIPMQSLYRDCPMKERAWPWEAPATEMMELNHHGERFEGAESYKHPKLIEFYPVCDRSYILGWRLFIWTGRAQPWRWISGFLWSMEWYLSTCQE